MKWYEKLIEKMVGDGVVDKDDKGNLQNILENYELDQDGEGASAGKVSVNMESVPDGMKDTVSQLVDTVNALKEQNKQLINSLNEEKKARKEALETQKEEQKKKREKQVSELVEKAIGDEDNPGKLPESKKEWFENFAKNDLDAASEWLDEAPQDPRLAGDDDGKDDKTKKSKKSKNPMLDSVGGVDDNILKTVQEKSHVE